MMPVSVILAVLGLYYISFAGVPSVSTGDLLTVCCAFMFAVQIVLIDTLAGDLDALRLNTIQALVCTILSSVVMVFAEEPTWSGISACWIPLLHTGLLSMGAAYSLQILAQKNIEPSAASLIMSLESVFAVIFGVIILKETMTPWETAGCILVFSAVIISQIPVNAKKQPVN